MTQTPETPLQRMDRLEAALGRFAEITIQNIQRHDQEMFELRGVMTDLATQQQQTNRSLEALSQTQAECLQLIATNTVEINRIWQYLERQTGNGRSGGEG